MVRVQTEDFDIAALYQALRSDARNAGGIATFTGLVREFYEPEDEGRVDAVRSLFLEHYPGMTEKALADIETQARERWDVLACQVVHRVGELHAGEQIVFVGVASTHRGDAFAAAEFIMDYLKTRAPFWKKQKSGEQSEWIESRASDELARARWETRS
ncbi:MAG: molybdenum cofactor biosynthesis protein MoaE [Pseudomonadales bacterium]|nr:molybdenum cofactor biosynthesis protein MoaE [Pseudomonadales bacterium]